MNSSSARCKIHELGANWKAEIDFDFDKPPDGPLKIEVHDVWLVAVFDDSSGTAFSLNTSINVDLKSLTLESQDALHLAIEREIAWATVADEE